MSYKQSLLSVKAVLKGVKIAIASKGSFYKCSSCIPSIIQYMVARWSEAVKVLCILIY